MVAPPATTTKVPGAFHSVTPAQLQRPSSSQPTSVKAEPGSNVAPSDSSKKEVPDSSPIASVIGDYTSDPPCSSNPTTTKVSP